MSDLIPAYAAHLRAAGYSANTIYGRTRVLHRLADELPEGLDCASPAELALWFGQWEEWTLHTYWLHANGFYAWASGGRRPHIEWNPMCELVRPRAPKREPRPATDEQIGAALGELQGPWRLGVLIATAQGLRCAEICRLDRHHITSQDIHTSRKGRKQQLLPTHPAVWDAVAGLPPGPVIRTSHGARFESDYYSHRVSDELTAIGLPDLTLHRFRASFATRLADEGWHMTVIQDLMGHASIETTRGYVKVKDEKRRLAIQTLPVPNGNQQAAA